MIGADVYNKLKGTAAIASLVSTRIFPNEAKTDVLPLLVYELDGLQPNELHGQSATDARIDLTVTAVATTYAAMQQLTSAVITALTGWRDAKVLGCWCEGTNEMPIIDAENDNISYYTNEVSFDLIFNL